MKKIKVFLSAFAFLIAIGAAVTTQAYEALVNTEPNNFDGPAMGCDSCTTPQGWIDGDYECNTTVTGNDGLCTCSGGDAKTDACATLYKHDL